MIRELEILRQWGLSLGIMVLLVLLVPAGAARAFVTTYWTAGVGDWHVPGNWSQGVPGGDDSAIVDNGGTAQIMSQDAVVSWLEVGRGATGTVEQSAFSLTATNVIFVGVVPAGQGFYNLNGGSIGSPAQFIGLGGSGTFTHTGGVNHVGHLGLFLGYYEGGQGTYNLEGTGFLEAHDRDVFIGHAGAGIFNQSGNSQADILRLRLGEESTGTGSYNLSSGNLTVQMEDIGVFGSGSFNQSGGTHHVSQLTLGYENSGSGTYDLSGGTLSLVGGVLVGWSGNGTFNLSGTGNLSVIGATLVGYEGTGSFTQTGGTNTVDGVLCLADRPGGSGTYTLSGLGVLSVSDLMVVGLEGTGTFIQTGGSNTVNGSLYVGQKAGGSGTFDQDGGNTMITDFLALGYEAGSSGTYNLKHGILQAGNEFIGFRGSGTFKQTGGLNSVANLVLGRHEGSSGTYDQSGGTTKVLTSLTQGFEAGSSGTYRLSGASALIVSGYLYVGYQGTGIFEQSGGSLATDFLHVGDYGSGTFTQTGGSNTVTFELIIGHHPEGTGAYHFLGGSLEAGNILVGSTGTFLGQGTLSAQFTNDGLVKPGSSVGSLNISGSYTQGPGGTLEVEVASATAYDRLTVSGTPGTASLAGTLKPVLLSGYLPPLGQTFPGVITTTGGLTGTFDTLANQQIAAAKYWHALYHADSLDLEVVSEFIPTSGTLSHSQLQVAQVLESLVSSATGDLAQVLNTIANLPTIGALAEAYQQLSPDKAASLPDLGLAAGKLQQQRLARRITDLRFGAGETGLAGGWPGAFSLSGSTSRGLLLAFNSGSLASLAPTTRHAAAGKWGLWLDPAGVLGHVRSTRVQTGYDYAISGFGLGADLWLRDRLLVGLATGYSYTDAHFKGSGGRVTSHTWPLTAYGAYLADTWYAFGSLGYALNLFELRRKIAIGGLSRTAKGSPAGHQLNFYGEAGYDLKVKPLVVTPTISLAYAHLGVDGFMETGAGALNLKVAAQSADSLKLGVGAKVAVPLKRQKVTVVPQVYASYQHEFLNGNRGLDARLATAGGNFTFRTDHVGRDFAVVGGNVTFLGKKVSGYINYNAEVGRSKSSAHFLGAAVRWQF